MLQTIHIQNYALIEKLDIRFNNGFSVITGETGAGKSIILGAIGLLLGQRADAKSIRQGASKCVIEASFDVPDESMKAFFEERDLDYDEECILRRELTATGKSRAFVNDQPVSLALLKELGEQLIDIHSQHQNLLLNKEDFLLNVLDILSHSEAQRTSYKTLYTSWQQAVKELDELLESIRKAKKDEEYVRFQWEQLAEVKLSEGEQEELEQELDTLNHTEDIKGGLYKVLQSADADDNGLVDQLREHVSTLSALETNYPPAVELARRMESVYIEVKDMIEEIASRVETIEFDPNRLQTVSERLNLIYSLQQKHHVQTVGELIALEQKLQAQLAAITSSAETVSALTERRDNLYNKVLEEAEHLTALRRKAGMQLEQEMVARLIPLGMPNVRFKVDMSKREQPGPQGIDAVNFLFSANKNSTLQNLSSVASGGEIARVMLSIKAVIAGAVKLPTIIFDEIDTGVSGSIADRMGDIMQEMGEKKRQVISITHLPQIAAKGKTHYKVYKQDKETETVSYIEQLTDGQRVEEIAHMLSGSVLTDSAVNNARELLRLGNHN